MQSFDIVTLRVFLALSREGSIGAAARTEHIAVSAASRRLSDLEHDLGTTLINRTPAGATLTPAGHTFARHCERLLHQYAEVRTDLLRYAEGEVGILRIAALSSVMNGRLPHQVKRFREAYPHVETHLKEIKSYDGVRYLREDLADLVVISDTEKHQGFQVEPYTTDPVWVVGHADHALFAGRPAGASVAFAETIPFEHISFAEGGVMDELVAEAHRQAGCKPTYLTKVMRLDAVRNCVEAGLGLCFIRESSIKHHLKGRHIKGAPLSDDWAARGLIMLYPEQHAVSPLVQRFLDVVKNEEAD